MQICQRDDVEELEDYEIKDGKDKIRLTVSGTYEQFKVFKKSKKLFPMLYFSRLMGTPTID